MSASEKMATIEVRTSHIGFSFLQALCRPVIEIDGKPHPASWGSHSFSVTPGQHNIKAYHRWMLIREAYASSVNVTASEGQILKLHWHTDGSPCARENGRSYESQPCCERLGGARPAGPAPSAFSGRKLLYTAGQLALLLKGALKGSVR
jgi:hypothetical protein